MAHELTETDGMFSAVQTPWHGLGVVTAGALSLDEALVTASLDWTVTKEPMYVMGAAGVTQVPNRWAVVRSDVAEPLGVVGDGYRVLQNSEGFDMLGALLEGGEVEVETAGSLRGGRHVWALARLHRDLHIDGDEHVPYVLFTTSHDGSSSVKVATTPVRVVCMNTLRWALQGARSTWSVRHTASVADRVDEARKTLRLAWTFYDEFEHDVRYLMSRPVTEAQFEQVVQRTFPTPKDATDQQRARAEDRRGQVASIYLRSTEVGEFTGTAWGTLQAFNTWDLWKRPTRGGQPLEQQAMRVLTGRTEAFTQEVRRHLAAVGAA